MDRMQKGLDSIVKGAGMVICVPVTWLVAGQVFGDIGGILRYVVQLAAVLLVEGVFLSNWLLLETNKSAAPEVKARYALTALAMYGGVWVLAWQHGEGAAGLVFRLALGAALIGTGWDTYVITWQKLTAKADRDVTATRHVRKHRRQAETKIAKLQVDSWSTLAEKRLRLETERADSTLQREHQAALQDGVTPALAASTAIHDLQPYKIPVINRARQLSKTARLQRFQQHMTAHPDTSASALVQWAARQFTVSESTAWKDYRALKLEHATAPGNGHRAAEPPEIIIRTEVR